MSVRIYGLAANKFVADTQQGRRGLTVAGGGMRRCEYIAMGKKCSGWVGSVDVRKQEITINFECKDF